VNQENNRRKRYITIFVYAAPESELFAGSQSHHTVCKPEAIYKFKLWQSRFVTVSVSIIVYSVVKKLAKKVLVILSAMTLAVGLLAWRVYSFRNNTSDGPADAAVVLGAAVWTREPSPVFKERINHAINLYQKGRVRKLIFTGGQGNPGEPTEASAARDYALQSGLPASDILIEDKSHTTYENVLNAKQLADAHGIHTVLIVSDPLHMKRAMTMARDVGLLAHPSPTPSTRYHGLSSQLGLLIHETYYYLGYLLRRPFL
jgi:uncharacterized SAM-binding protein YcdF (DUF218 family)